MKTILIIETDSYRRNTLTRKLVDYGFLVFDVHDQNEAIDIVLSLADTSPIHYILASSDHLPSSTLLKFCELKFKAAPKLLCELEMFDKTSDETVA